MNEQGEPTQADVERAYPGWKTSVGTDRRCYARRVTPGAALTAGPGEDWLDLLDQIRRAEAMLEDTPEAWR